MEIKVTMLSKLIELYNNGDDQNNKKLSAVGRLTVELEFCCL